MNKKNEMLAELEFKSLIKRRCLSRRNCVKYWGGTTRDHFLTMCDICHKLAQNGYHFYTEVESMDGTWRADIFAVNGSVCQIIEILHSETEAKFAKKQETYPEDIILRRVNTKDFNIDEFDI